MGKSLYIVLSHSGTRVSKFFSLTTGFIYSHVSISLDKELNQLYSFGRRNLYIPLISGFVREIKNQGVYKIHQNTPCMVFELPVSDEEYERAQEVITSFIEEKEKYKYNILGLPMLFFNIPYRREHHFTCSQFVACVLYKAGIIDISKGDKDYTVYTPEDFYNFPTKSLVYSGVLQEYN
jgi:hypothetical protein